MFELARIIALLHHRDTGLDPWNKPESGFDPWKNKLGSGSSRQTWSGYDRKKYSGSGLVKIMLEDKFDFRWILKRYSYFDWIRTFSNNGSGPYSGY